MGRIPLRTRAWFGDDEIELPIPDRWTVDVLPPADGPALSDQEMRACLDRALGCDALAQMARGVTSVLIVIDDLGRPTPTHRIAPFVVKTLLAAGVDDGAISFIVATGSHRQLKTDEIERKLGSDLASRFPVHCHDACHDEMCDLGPLPSGMPVVVNRRVVDADLVIGISCVLPHTLAGFSGGGKIMMPGLAGLRSIAELHSFSPKRQRGDTDSSGRHPDGRELIEAFASRAGLDFSINTVVNTRREVTGLFAGSHIDAHRRAVEHAYKVYQTIVSADVRQNADIVIVNGYPMDADPVQVSKSQWVRRLFPGAQMILVDDACDGIAYHGWSEFQKANVTNMLCGTISEARTAGRYPAPLAALLSRRFFHRWATRRFARQVNHIDVSYQAFEAGKPLLFRNSLAKRVMAKRAPLIICSAEFPEWKRQAQFPNSLLYRSWEEVGTAGHLPDKPLRVAVLPCAPLQLVSEI
ncbi:MAG: lactate racemase domain-containing protein [Candidatus Latescibacterota bacterium]|nr:lactate racemase domain-containing protein [Candidatus Latescibacterota bacterium]